MTLLKKQDSHVGHCEIILKLTKSSKDMNSLFQFCFDLERLGIKLMNEIKNFDRDFNMHFLSFQQFQMSILISEIQALGDGGWVEWVDVGVVGDAVGTF